MFGFGMKAMIGMVSPGQVREVLGEMLPQLNEEIKKRLIEKYCNGDGTNVHFILVTTDKGSAFVIVHSSDRRLEIGRAVPVKELLDSVGDQEIRELLNKIADGQ